MKLYFNLLLALLLCATTKLYAQKHYIVEIDRINNQTAYKQKVFDKGKPSEKSINQPSVRNGDLITVRIINFNELLYGLEIDGERIEKDQSPVSELLDKGSSILRMTPMSASMDLLTDLLTNTPTSITRGSSASSASLVHKKLLELTGSISNTQSTLKAIVQDEGSTLNEIKERVELLDQAFLPNQLKKSYASTKNDFNKIPDSEKDDDEYRKLEEELSDYDGDNDIDNTFLTIKNVRKLLRQVDFIQEKTMVVGGNSSYRSTEYQSYKIQVRIYKRANPLVDVKQYEVTTKPYDYSRYGEDDGDYLHQYLERDLKMAYKRQLYFSVGVNRIFVPANRFTYTPEEDLFGDSIKFASKKVGGGVTAVGLHMNYDLPIRSGVLTTSATLGYAVSFSSGDDSESGVGFGQIKKGFVTTGFSTKFLKFPYLAINVGCAWSRYQKLSDKYRADVFYKNNLTENEIQAQITKKIRPAFYAGISLNL